MTVDRETVDRETVAPQASPREMAVELDHDPVEALRRVAHAASDWGAKWTREGAVEGRLELPVLAGLRRGWVEGRVTAEAKGEGSRLVFCQEGSQYRLETVSVVFLMLGALGTLVVLVAPLVPALWPALPPGVLLAVAAWLFIVARLRNSGPEEFFGSLSEETDPQEGNS